VQPGGSESTGAPWWTRARQVRAAAGLAAAAVLAVAILTAPDEGGGGDAVPSSGRDTGPSGTASTAPAVDIPGGTYTTVPTRWDHVPSAVPTPQELAGLVFTDITAAAGLDHPHLDRTPDEANDMSGGAAVGDYDADGDLDIYLTRVGLPNLLHRNDGDGSFTDVTAEAGVGGAAPEAGYTGATFADLDGDADLDLYVTTVGATAPVAYINQGDGTFVDEAAERGLAWPDATGTSPQANLFGSALADWDVDGDLDLAVVDWYTDPTGHFATEVEPELRGRGEATWAANDQCARAAAMRTGDHAVPDGTRAPGTRLLENDGSGRFSDVTAAMGIDPVALAAFGATFADYDDDGWPDLFVSADFCTSRVYRNERGRRFVDATDELGVGTDENGMGQAVEDIDGDGTLDWVVSSISLPRDEAPCPTQVGTIGCTGNRLFLGGSDGFTDATDRFGVRDAFWAWGVVAQDLTNTGRRDLVITAGWTDPDHVPADLERPDWAIWRRSAGSPTRLWRNTGTGPWPEVADAAGLVDRGNGKALIAFDLDDDGDLDLLKVNTEAAPVLYRNDTPTGPGRQWIRLRLRDAAGPNTRGIGARVTVVTTSGRRAVAEVRAGGSFQSGDPDEVHVGLGADGVARVEVRWPGEDGVETFHPPADAVSELTRGEGA
jgi:hypothetical protein